MTRAAWWLGLTAVLLIGCPPPPAPPMDAGVDAGVSVSAVELCERISVASCELKARCYPAFLRLTKSECVEQSRASCLAETERLQSSFASGRAAVNVAQLEGCERRLTSSACPPSFPPDYPANVAQPFSDCRLSTGLLTGFQPVGAKCDAPVECGAGTFCVKPSGVCEGTCIAYSQLDEPCGIGCVEGLRCDGMKCTYLKTLDELCDSSAECEPELICLGRCRPRRKLGEACRTDFDRLSPCEPGLACDVTPFVDGAEGTCVVPGDFFADCRFHWSCRPGLVCADRDWSTFPGASPPPGFCRLPDGERANCSQTAYGAFVGDQCEPGLTCGDGTNQCETLPARGEPCTPSKQNCSGFEVHCKPTGTGDVGVCAGPANLGERCAVKLDASRTVAIPCSSGFCETEITQQCRPASRTTGSECTQDGECISGRCVPQPDRTLRCVPAC